MNDPKRRGLSTMIPEILEQHALDAAFLWHLRDFAVTSPRYDLAGLDDLDERLEAHLDGLRIGGAEARAICRDELDGGAEGAAFAAAVLTFEHGDEQEIERILDAATERARAREVASALGWLPIEGAARALDPLLASEEPSRRRLALAACAAHRRDPGRALADALVDTRVPLVQARALRAAGELGRRDLLADVVRALGSPEPEARFWAAWSAALLGEGAAVPTLWGIAEAGGPRAEAAGAMAARHTAPDVATHRLRELASAPEHARAAIAGAGALGHPALVPTLLELIAEPALARVAGDAFTTITGIAIEQGLAGAPPPGAASGPSDDPRDDRVALDPDGGLPWPAAEVVREAWRARAPDLPSGARLFCGAPLTAASLRRILTEGNQRRRADAAAELVLLRRGAPLFEVRAPAARQRRSLS